MLDQAADASGVLSAGFSGAHVRPAMHEPCAHVLGAAEIVLVTCDFRHQAICLREMNPQWRTPSHDHWSDLAGGGRRGLRCGGLRCNWRRMAGE